MQQHAFPASQPQVSASRNSLTPPVHLFEQPRAEPTSRAAHDRRESSTSDEFSSFVSVSTSDDPLGAGSAGLEPTSPTTTSVFGAFADNARKRAKEDGQRVLDELRAHDEDPLAWFNSNRDRMSDDRQWRGEDSSPLPVSEDSSALGDGQSARAEAAEPGKDSLTQLITLDEANSALRSEKTKHTSSLDLSDSGSGKDPFRPADWKNFDAPSSSILPSSSVSSLNISEGLMERAQQHERRILDELRSHDEDPLAWLKSKADDDSDMPSALQEAGSTLIDLSTPASEAPQLPSRSRTPSVTSHGSTSPLPNVPRAISTPLIPRSSDRARSQSPGARVPKSPSIKSSIGLPRSWMSSLGLFSAPRPVPASSSPSAARGTHDGPSDAGEVGLSPTQSSLHALFAKAGPPSPRIRRHTRFATEGHSPMHAATMPLPTASGLTSDASPFASHVYVPPTGAPGFTGDHNWNPEGFEFDTQTKTGGRDVRLIGRNDITVPVLSSVIATTLRPHLPPLLRLAQSWRLLYSADQHGISINTLYARCAPPVIVGGGGLVPGVSTGALVAVQDAEGGVFGAWIPEGVHLSHGSYYGGGDSFLWSVERKDMESEDDLHIYKWTGKNVYVAYCDTDGFSFGGGDGHYGLYVDASLVEGTTHPCPTFDNECLAHGERKGRMVTFDAVGLEVWAIGS
ncbi:OXR1 [Sanghuangporus vaninii]